jgi:hypothetical protein
VRLFEAEKSKSKTLKKYLWEVVGIAGNHLLDDGAGNILIEGGESKGQGFVGSFMLKSGSGSLSGVLELQP